MPDSGRDSLRSGALLDRLTRPASLVAVGAILAVSAFHLWLDPDNPPGFIRDEASIAYNAHTISQTLRDQDGGLLPLYFTSYDDYKSPVFVYALAGVFRVSGPHAEVARALAAVCVLAAVFALGLIALRRSRSALVAVSTVVLAGATPWLFELGRVAYETSLLPLAICVVVLLVEACARVGAWTIRRAIPVGLALGGLAYVYAAGRLLAPLLAFALVVFASRERWRWLLAAWGTFGATVLPLAAYSLRHPGALSARYEATTFIRDEMSLGEILTTAISNYVRDVDLWRWVTAGDPKPYIHAHGTGSLLAVVAVLALAGAVLLLVRERGDLFWRYVLVAAVLSPVPAALTKDRFYALRLVPFAVLLLVLAIPALAAIVAAARTSRLGRFAVAALVAAVAVQLAHFLDVYRDAGPGRAKLFEAAVPDLLHEAFSAGETLYVDYDDRYAQTHALWYAVENGIPRTRVSILPDGGVPPAGSIVFGRLQPCDYACRELVRSNEYWVARAVG